MEGGPWGIVIVISALMIQVFIFGVSGTIGMYNIEFLEYFQTSASQVSLISALNYGLFLGSGPLVSLLMSKISYRKVSLGGSFLVVFGLATVPLFPNLYFLYLTVGVLVGFGSCCVYIPSHTLSGLYYDKYRSLATGIATSGSGLGFAVMPIVVGLLIDTYSWKGSFVMLAGISLHLFIFAALLRDPPMEPQGDNLEIVVGKNLEDFDELTFDVNENGSVLALDRNVDSNKLLERNRHTVPCLENGSQKENFIKETEKTSQLPDSARHVYIFKNFSFVIYFVNNVFWNMSASIMIAFFPEYFHGKGFSFLEVSWLIGCVGIGTFLGGILGGILGNIKGVNRINQFIVTCFLLAISTFLVAVNQNLVFLVSVLVLNGLAFGVILGLLMVVLTDLVGIQSLGNGMGYLMLSNGLGTFTGPIFCGILIDYTGNFEISVYVAAILTLISGMVMILIPLQSYRNRKNLCVKTNGDQIG